MDEPRIHVCTEANDCPVTTSPHNYDRCSECDKLLCFHTQTWDMLATKKMCAECAVKFVKEADEDLEVFTPEGVK